MKSEFGAVKSHSDPESSVMLVSNIGDSFYRLNRELISELLALGVQVHLVCPYGKDIPYFKEKGCFYHEINVNRRSINPIGNFTFFLSLYKIIKLVKPDRLLTYSIKPNVYGGLAARMLKITYAATVTGIGSGFYKNGIMKSFLSILNRVALKRAKYVFFENDYNRQFFCDMKICEMSQTIVLSGAGVNTEHFAFTPMPSGAPVFLFIGRIMREKGVDEFFEAARLILREYPPVSFQMLGPMEDDYSERIAELQEQGVVTYLGTTLDVRPFIAKCHCLVLPSYHEGMANVLLEAASMGRPLIMSDIPGCREASNGKNALLCISKDSYSLFMQMKLFLGLSETQRSEMGIQSREHMKKSFERAAVVAHVIKILELP